MTEIPELSVDDERPIVMVDDNYGDLKLAEICLERSVLRNPWLPFTGGPDFLAYLEEVEAGRALMPALVLLDINMPLMPGIEVLRRVRAREFFSSMPLFCMLTSSSDPVDRQRAEKVGASGFGIKPDDPDEFVAFFDAMANRGA